MTFYHGTDEDSWNEIVNEGVLWGKRYVLDKYGNLSKGSQPDRCTYLTNEKKIAKIYGKVILEVEYEPSKSTNNNYDASSWQMRVYEPIPLSNVKRIK